VFNERGCANCHANGAIGGAGENIERRFGTFTNGAFNGLPQFGGSLRQLFSVVRFNNRHSMDPRPSRHAEGPRRHEPVLIPGRPRCGVPG
jgi:hypothetical protein